VTSDPLQKFVPGQPLGSLRAATANAWTDAARAVRGLQSVGQRVRSADPNPPCLTVMIKNDTGGTLTERSVVQVSFPLQIPTIYGDDIQRGPWFAGIAPTSPAGTPAVLLEPIPAGELGRAVIMGVAVVSVDITDAAHTRATLDTGDTAALVSGTSGPATILWRETGTGVKLCAVLLCCGTGVPAVGDSEDWVYPADGVAASLTSCSPCGGDIALPLAYLNFTSKTGEAVCLPDSVPLTRIPAMDSTSGFHTGNPPGWILKGASQSAGVYFGEASYCGGTYADCVHVWLTCGTSGPAVNYVGYQTSNPALFGPLNGGAFTTADLACGAFGSPGTVTLGTITHVGTLPGGDSSSVVVTLSWE
jgi:hypothetical protein